MTISSFCTEQLRTRGPLTLEALTDLATDSGATTARNPLASVRSAIAPRAVQLGDGRWASPLRLLEGRVLTTHRAVRAWYDDELLSAPSLDLELLRTAAREAAIPVEGGGLLKCTTYSTLALPSFSGVTLGPEDLLGLRLRDGVLHAEPVPVTPEMRQSGRLLADALGALDTTSPPYWSTGLHAVSDNLNRALWDRMAADLEFLTSPVPPFSECIPALAHALSVERERQYERSRHWQVHLDLPADVRWAADRASGLAGASLSDWLNAFAANALRELGESYDDDRYDDPPYQPDRSELPFPRRLRSI